ncbi:unnamed protein product [Symbiodinium pilosum]|uniref:Uncharacterized protein n=1 Tax=Symbiodinium pilosum TaxID=2952 RepID=A0A812VRK5_SYMPI|nr:unnamed protein product [Symbiodinium pilosum]
MAVTLGAPLRSLTPHAQVLRQGSVPVLRRPGSVSSGGSATPQNGVYTGAVRILPPSGASTPAQPSSVACPVQPDVCPSCGWVYMPDAIFCRHCGQKREVIQAEVHSPGYLAAGVASPMPEAYAGDGFTYGNGTVSPCLAGTVVYSAEASLPAYSSTGTVSPLPGAAVAGEVATYLPGAASPMPPRVLGTKLSPPTRVSASMMPGQAMFMEPTALPNQCAPVSMTVPAGSSCEVPAATLSVISNAVSSNGYASTRISSYAPAVQVTGASYALPSVLPQKASTPGVPMKYSVVPAATQTAPPSGSSTPAMSCWGAVTPLPPPPAMVLGSEPGPVPAEPQVPPSLTAGLPDPTSIERQKSAYARGLDDQLKHGTEVLAQQLKQQADNLFAANALLLEYNQKKAQEDLAYQQYQFQKRQYETQLQYNDEMKELQAQQQAATAQVAQQRAFIAQQAARLSVFG